MPLLLVVVLAILLIVQFTLPRDRASTRASGALPHAPPSVMLADAYVAPSILAHPIFTPTRGVGAGLGDSASEPQFSDYALVGVTRTRGFASATLSGPGGRLASLRPGEEILGWRLESVAGDTATFASGGERRRLTAGGQTSIPAAPVGQLH